MPLKQPPAFLLPKFPTAPRTSAPPVYRPQVNAVAQPQSAPPVYRPDRGSSAQPKMGPPVYKPNLSQPLQKKARMLVQNPGCCSQLKPGSAPAAYRPVSSQQQPARVVSPVRLYSPQAGRGPGLPVQPPSTALGQRGAFPSAPNLPALSTSHVQRMPSFKPDHHPSQRSHVECQIIQRMKEISFPEPESDSSDISDEEDYGKDTREARTTKLKKRQRHFRNPRGLRKVLRIGTGFKKKKKPSETTLVLSKEGGSIYLLSSLSNRPLNDFMEEQGISFSYFRNKTGEHLHAEMKWLSGKVRAGQDVSKMSIIISKPCCPYCLAVLKAFGCTNIRPGSEGEFSKVWRNPFDKGTERANWDKVKQAVEKCQKDNKDELEDTKAGKTLNCT